MGDISVPSRCAEFCPVLNGADISEYSLVLTRNCKGPKVSSGEIAQKVQLHKDGTAFVIERTLGVIDANGNDRRVVFVDNIQNEMVCTNEGINNSINQLIEATEK